MAIAGGTGGVPDHTICAVKLKAGFLNGYYEKALPMGLPQFTIMITLASATDGLINGANGSTNINYKVCLLYTSPSPRDRTRSRMPSSA